MSKSELSLGEAKKSILAYLRSLPKGVSATPTKIGTAVRGTDGISSWASSHLKGLVSSGLVERVVGGSYKAVPVRESNKQ